MTLRHRRTLLAVLLILSTLSRAHATSPVYAPDWTGQRPGGGTVEFHASSRDHVTVVLFWATWCPYCAALMAELQTVADELGGTPVLFYALNIWDPEGDPIGYMQRRGYTFDLILNADGIATMYGVKGTPGLFVVDSQHRIRWARRAGMSAASAAAQARAAIDELLEELPVEPRAEIRDSH